MNDEPLLIPRPSRVRLTGERATMPRDAVAWASGALAGEAAPAWLNERATGGWCGADEREAQGYRLRVEREPEGKARVTAESPTAAGLRYARATLVQIIRQYANDPRGVPTLDIDDRPAFLRRGVMLDVSRCRIPTMPEFERIIDQLASLKCNHMQLYTEHTFAYSGAHEVWRDWSPITPDEVRTLDGWCGARGIELAANQNCFGHLRNWLEHPKYAALAETHGDWMFDVWPRSGPFSLCPTDPASMAFVEGLLGELLPCFSSGLVNIGCDETYDIAYGRSAAEVKARGRGVVFAEFVTKIAAAARRHGKRLMYWADIALSHPECLAMLPTDMIHLAWGYEADAAWEKWCVALKEHRRDGRHGDQACATHTEEGGGGVWLCPGSSSWRSFTGRTHERRGNIDGAARVGVAHGAEGMLICDWGDSGHWQPWPIALHGIADGLEAAWSVPSKPEASAREMSLRAESLHLFNDATGRAGRWLERLGDADLPLRRECMPLSRPGVPGHIRNQTAIFADLFQPWAASREVGALHLWVEAHEFLRELLQTCPRTGDALVDDELRLAATMAVRAAARGKARRMTSDDAIVHADQQREWADSQAEHRRLWAKRSRPGGLEQSCAFFGRIDHGPGAKDV